MDFVTGLLCTPCSNDATCAIVDRLTKSTHFLSYKIRTSIEKLIVMYMIEVIKLHGVLVSMVSNRDTRFLSHFGLIYRRHLVPS